jgi:hypothetical protein
MTTLQPDHYEVVATASFSDWLFPGVFIVVGFAIICFGVRNAERAFVSTNWPKADGIIRSSIDHRSSNKNGITYQADVSYDYAVSGVPYSGSEVSFSQFGLGNAPHAQSIVASYPKGKKVKVSYAPDHPDLSVLETGLTIADSFLPLGGAAFLVSGYFLGPSRKRKYDTDKPNARSPVSKLMRLRQFIIVSLLAAAASANASEVVNYHARLSEQDHLSADGKHLESVAAILSQDRANYHRFHKRDTNDQGDSFFITKAHRALFYKMKIVYKNFGRHPAQSVVNEYLDVDIQVIGLTVIVTVSAG